MGREFQTGITSIINARKRGEAHLRKIGVYERSFEKLKLKSEWPDQMRNEGPAPGIP